MLRNVEREAFERCVAHVTLRPDDFRMKDRVEAQVVRGGTVQFHTITVTYAPTRTCRVYYSSLPSAWCGPFRARLRKGSDAFKL
ncbi:hypothetical protein GAY30_11545 [Azospirillum brasilense]|uniref:hypothetical protein n=1 Tax=Azospirillum brasilense TaxID=192 RepID=UPI00157A5775|nr:hypothetical protein [Azospirillum brasilense]NUB25522.1 hypothetical protein [Azospirillum brasilense]NUB31519.1 hypothetical protein [Azospirillum brasilense]